MTQYPFFHGAPSGAFERARQLRSSMTPAEEELWKHLRRKQIDGFRFRRQHPVSHFILDFYCHEVMFAIEVDGSIHDLEDQKQYDMERDHSIRDLGIEIIRIKNNEVFEDLANVLAKIRERLKYRLQVLKKSSPDGEDLGGGNT